MATPDTVLAPPPGPAPPGTAPPVRTQDTPSVPPKTTLPRGGAGLNEDLVRILRENLLQQECPSCTSLDTLHASSAVPYVSSSGSVSPRNSPCLLRRMLLSTNLHRQRRFTVAHTW
ncbi:hypothetical protein DPEC_G00320860 [Dallia pectoralis]|uniref:Uncharacterized protein n=1 Tax=Dallia pectoralis TaxID=75939 RepID=A0ACC2FA13_DALPE|nr:hypothetical protein DPEC_G00320860 [Dallia pectoralis]